MEQEWNPVDTCEEFALVSTEDEPANLVCSLRPGHPGPLHHDGVDGIWWALDDAPHEGDS